MTNPIEVKYVWRIANRIKLENALSCLASAHRTVWEVLYPPTRSRRDRLDYWEQINRVAELYGLDERMTAIAPHVGKIRISVPPGLLQGDSIFRSIMQCASRLPNAVHIEPGVLASWCWREDGGQYATLDWCNGWRRLRGAVEQAASQTGSECCLVDWERCADWCLRNRNVDPELIRRSIRQSGIADCGVRLIHNCAVPTPGRPDLAMLFHLFRDELPGSWYMGPPKKADDDGRRAGILGFAGADKVITRLICRLGDRGLCNAHGPVCLPTWIAAHDGLLSLWAELPANMTDLSERAAERLRIVQAKAAALRAYGAEQEAASE